MVPKKSLSFGGGLRSGPDDGSLIKASKRLARYPQIQLRHQVVALLSVTIAVKARAAAARTTTTASTSPSAQSTL